MYTIGQLAKRFDLSRSTLLYYDNIGLLKPSDRSGANYRKYSEDDVRRLEQICMYREAGLPLETIAQIVNAPNKTSLADVLERRLDELNEQIRELRHQQHVITQILKNHQVLSKVKVLSKDDWVGLMRAAGLDETDMRQWHIEFDRLSPAGHQSFLESLGISAEEVRKIREWSQKGSSD
ncbi:MAG: MerR family transcriptional regulator [Candidatus Vecturithrix sp.]|jgi:DNA-binding transcriptional MerR regulator|nr:MerR family transcriptional regulator [Candidatus Vecturithrix sp.]